MKGWSSNPGALLSVTAMVRPPGPCAFVWPEFMQCDPIGGDALIATQNGLGSFGIHGGDLQADGRLHERYGCLRVDNDAAVHLAGLIRPQLQAGRQVLYKCQIV